MGRHGNGKSGGQIRLLHVVENLHTQAIETWLFRMFRGAAEEYRRFHWTFFCALGKEGKLDEAVRALGADIIYSPYEISNTYAFVSNLRGVIKEGRYNVLHCHHDIMSAIYLWASVGLPFKKRIVHVHNTSLSLPTSNRLKTALLRPLLKQLCLMMSDNLVGISREALRSMIGEREPRPERDKIVHYGVDTTRFYAPPPDPAEFRQSLGLPPAAKIMLFVGRMVPYKNPKFVVEVLEHISKKHPDVVAVFAGAGVLEEGVRAMARERELDGRVRVLGFRDDVPRLMQGSDLLIWPGLECPMEGLGLGIVEAQAAGLPVLMSLSVPHEAVVIPELVETLHLAAGAKAWADAVSTILVRKHPTRQEALSRVDSSSFSLPQGIANLMALYTALT